VPKRTSNTEDFVRMRPPGGKNRRGRAAVGEHKLDQEYPEFALRAAEQRAAEPESRHAGDRWSTWDQSTPLERGPRPHPDWLVNELAAVDTELGVLKTGKEADVFLLERGVPGTGRATLIAAKRYRDSEHRMFHRDAGYVEGRRDKESRINRATAKRTAFGRQVIAGQWANAEFTALCRLWKAGAAVPYPIQILGTELLMEFIGDPDGTAAPRLAQVRPSPGELAELWDQLRHSLSLMARDGFTHGDLSAYNVLVHRGRLVIIDVPQIVDLLGNPLGPAVLDLDRDVRTIGAWFVAHGLAAERVDELAADLLSDAGLT
jgi:serine/threonine-protein kinase RIO1